MNSQDNSQESLVSSHRNCSCKGPNDLNVCDEIGMKSFIKVMQQKMKDVSFGWPQIYPLIHITKRVYENKMTVLLIYSRGISWVNSLK